MHKHIEITCPRCHGTSIKKNGKKRNGAQNYRCKECGRQFIHESDIRCEGHKPKVILSLLLMLMRGSGVRDIREVLHVSFTMISNVIKNLDYHIKPAAAHYDTLEIGEFWTYIGNKKRKAWLIYAYHRSSGQAVACVWGHRDKKTAQKLKKKLWSSGITCDRIATDDWKSFIAVFGGPSHLTGKYHTVGIEGSNCRFRHRNRRVFRQTCCFSKKPEYHYKVFNAIIFYINKGCLQ
jgi:IS1 family transposase/transposase-like protein